MRNTKILFATTLVCLFVSIAANAQKMPNVQQGSVRAPADIKIDGKATEWNNQFKAYNHATDIFYTLSNDDENLYLTVLATDPNIIRKIMSGGVCLTVQLSGKKIDKGGMSITYPVSDNSKTKVFLGGGFKRDSKSDALAMTDKDADSVMMARNKQFNQTVKWIGVTGIKDLDTLISVYNQDGIRAVGRYDNKGTFTYEMSVTLKLLGLSVDNPAKFSYHILLNGVSLYNSNKRPDQVISVMGTGAPMGGAESSLLSAKIMLDQGSIAPTDFWGEYTLAKK